MRPSPTITEKMSSGDVSSPGGDGQDPGELQTKTDTPPESSGESSINTFGSNESARNEESRRVLFAISDAAKGGSGRSVGSERFHLRSKPSHTHALTGANLAGDTTQRQGSDSSVFAPFDGNAFGRRDNENTQLRRISRRRNSMGSIEVLPEENFRLNARRSLSRDQSEWTGAQEMDLRDGVRAGSEEKLEAALLRSNVRQDLMAQNAENGAGLLMLAVSAGKVSMLRYLADAINKRLGKTLLARQLRYEDDEESPLMFYAASSSKDMFVAVKKLVRETIGVAGLAEQLRHQCAKGENVLMRASHDPDVFMEVWKLLERTDCLAELMGEEDKMGMSWVHHSAQAGNLSIFQKVELKDLYALFCLEDGRGWNGFMCAARGKGPRSLDFLSMLCGLCFAETGEQARLEEQVTRVADDEDHSNLLMHAAIGGRESYAYVCGIVRDVKICDQPVEYDKDAMLLSWAAKGGDISVLNTVAGGIKTGKFPDGSPYERWYDVGNGAAEERQLLLDAVRMCAKRREGTSLFLSAIRSGKPAMIKAVVEGCNKLVPNAKACWETLCGEEGNPLVIAASESVEVFRETFLALKGVASRGSTLGLKPLLLTLLLPEMEMTPLCSAVLNESPSLFDEVLEQADKMALEADREPLDAGELIQQVRYAMRKVDQEGRLTSQWISAKMLARVLEAMKGEDQDGIDANFDVTLLDDFVEVTVDIGAFDHVRELLKNGCRVVRYFPSLLAKIGINESKTSECMILAITSASNPFVVCGIASQAIYEATLKRQMNHAALGRLQQKIGELTLELIEHLPHSVSGVGDELARGDPDLEPFYSVGKVRPSELLGFAVVGWMLEGSGQPNHRDDSHLQGVQNALMQAVRSGSRALELLSEALVLDYLGLKFNRTLPRWNTSKPFERNINQSFYSYRHQARAREADEDPPREGHFQWLLLLLQGWENKKRLIPHRTILPGMQFTLAGIMGKPASYYVVPAIRTAFVVISYLTTMGLYLSCVALQSQDIPINEWAFYLFMLGVLWREMLEFSNASKSEPGLGASIERYFYDKWNFLDISTILFVFVAFVFRMLELTSGGTRNLFLAQFFLAASAPLLFSRVLFLAQLGSALGPMAQVVFNMLNALTSFSVVLILVMFGFAASFNALYGTDTILVERLAGAACDVNDHPIVGEFGTLGDALLTMFVSMLGEFDLEPFFSRYEGANGEDCGEVTYVQAGILLMVIYLVIMAVILLNLLIAVLSTAHAEVQVNASKEYHLARAKIVLQSGEDVLNDVLPPPFNLIKPVAGMLWPVAAKKYDEWDRWWEILLGSLHRFIFAIVVGLGALGASTVLWVVSLPLVAWKLSHWLALKTGCKKNMVADPLDVGAGTSTRHFRYSSHGKRSRSMARSLYRSKNKANKSSSGESVAKLARDHSTQRTSFKADELKESVERIFFLDSAAKKGRFSPTNGITHVIQLVYLLLGTVLAFVLCFFVYPLMSVVLWLRGICGVAQYAHRVWSKSTPWERRQEDLGEEEEWSIARAHAITRNRRYRTSNSSENEFNVDALLKTTTGLTMDDLRQKMANLKTARRQRALGASLDAVLAQFPSEDKDS